MNLKEIQDKFFEKGELQLGELSWLIKGFAWLRKLSVHPAFRHKKPCDCITCLDYGEKVRYAKKQGWIL